MPLDLESLLCTQCNSVIICSFETRNTQLITASCTASSTPVITELAVAVCGSCRYTIACSGSVLLIQPAPLAKPWEKIFLQDLGVGWVILGHSERRALIKESSALIADKTGAPTMRHPTTG